MRDIQARLSDVLTVAASGRGAVSASLVPHARAEPVTAWVPESSGEPAFLAYSITKIFLAVLVLRLCEDKRMGLDDRLARWFPHVASADRISIRQLLNHTTGIPDYGGLSSYSDAVRADPSTPWSFERFAAETFDKGLWFEPGEGWAYSNPGYMLVKRITEEVGRESLRELVADRIAKPLGLQRTFVAESLQDMASLAPGMSRLLSPDGEPRDVRQHYHPGWVSHGVVASTASDLVRFLDQLFSGRILSAESLRQMTALVALPDEPPPEAGGPGYGLGLMGEPVPFGLILGHNGGGPCYGASAFHAPGVDGASACVMGAIEDNFRPQPVVVEILTRLAGDRHGRAARRRAGTDHTLT